MKLEQLSVFLENRAGQLADVIRILAEEGINIRGLSLADTSDFGILRLIVCEEEKAVQALTKWGFATGRTLVLAVSLCNESGALNELLQMISTAGINVEYMYGCAAARAGEASMIFRFDKIDEAMRLLSNHAFKLLSFEELCGSSE